MTVDTNSESSSSSYEEFVKVEHETNKKKVKIIFKTPTEIDNRSRSVVLALQQTFLDLLYRWSQSDSYHQHDVQEMCRLLIDHIETKTKETIVDGEISRLLEGKSQVSIKCLNVDFESKKIESFYDIQLSVKGMKNIYESFDQYCIDEVLEESNKYHAPQHGLQDAVRCISFLEFPPLLHLHLLRFVVNTMTYNYEKVCDRFEFPRQLQLDKYLSDESESKNKNDVYLLQSVLVHCGSTSGGHYIAYVSPNCDSIWYKFDDDIVSIVSEDDALEGNFGSNENFQRTAYTAYMLLYIKSSMLGNIR
ncbi:hypothetical protein MXB_1529 [Myxobolus squamalis]|nr:hypothetical protein MXB_1529 [Myxobolus squamalis]